MAGKALPQTIRGAQIEFNKKVAKYLFPTREARLGFACDVLKRDVESFNDIEEPEFVTLMAALDDAVQSEIPVNDLTTDCPACGVDPGGQHFKDCALL